MQSFHFGGRQRCYTPRAGLVWFRGGQVGEKYNKFFAKSVGKFATV